MARELGFPEAESLYAKVADYSPKRPVPSALLKEGFASIFDPVSFDRGEIERWLNAKPKDPEYRLTPACFEMGSVMLLKIGGKASHVAIVTDGRAIHAQIGAKDWVKETRLEALLKLFPLDSVWRWRDVG